MSGGGSGGGSSGVKYDNLEKLYGTQQQAAGFMLDQAMPRIPGILSNSQQMVGDAMSGALADQMRGRAAYDANQGIASSNNDAVRRLTAYGAVGDPSGGRFADVLNQNAFNSAKVRAGAMNTANNYAEDQKWNRNAGLYGQVSGMSTGAMQGMSSAGQGMSSLANMQNQNDMANAKGYGQFGSAIGSAMTKADGGYIRAPGLAAGGDAWQAYKAANPSASGGLSRRGGGRGQAVAQIFGGAAPHLLGAGLKDLAKGDKSKLISGAKDWYTKMTGPQQMSSTPASAGLEFETGPQAYDIVSGNIDGVAGLGSGVSAGFDATGAPAGVTYGGDIGADGVGAAASAGGSAVEGAGSAFSAADLAWLETPMSAGFADGGPVEKRGLRFALGGGVRSPIAANGVDNMDANMSMPRVAQMDDKAVSLPSQAQQAAVDTRYMGKTDGMGETSAGDPDGFGKYHGDYRGIVGKGVLTYFRAGFAAPLVHPIAEPLTRGMINAGDKAGGVTGAIITDPVGASASGKYSPDQIAAGNVAINLGVPWAGDAIYKASPKLYEKFFSEGGDVEPQRRADYTPGGDVRGPGTETSDDIPAWLSDGEFVLNAAAVKMIGKAKLEKLNAQGLKKREGKPAPKGKGRGLKLAKGGAAKKGC